MITFCSKMLHKRSLQNNAGPLGMVEWSQSHNCQVNKVKLSQEFDMISTETRSLSHEMHLTLDVLIDLEPFSFGSA